MNDVIHQVNYVTHLELKGTTFVKWKLFQNKKNTMNTIGVKGSWNELKGRLKQKFAVLTDNDLMFEEAKKEEMYGKLQLRLGKTKDEVLKIIASL